MNLVDAQLLERLSRLGPSFAVEVHRPDSPVVAPWLQFSALLRQPEVLRSRVTAVREALAAASGQQPEVVDRRMAVSVAQLALTARLLSPVLALAALGGVVPQLQPASLRWQPALGSDFPLSVPTDALAGRWGRVAGFGSDGTDPGSMSVAEVAEVADAFAEVLTGPVRALVHRCQAYSLSPQVLWGNVSSVLNSAASLIAAAEPSAARRTSQIVTRLLGQPPLVGTSRSGPGPGFVRLSCCLIYRLAAGPVQPVCGDCVLSRSPVRSCR